MIESHQSEAPQDITAYHNPRTGGPATFTVVQPKPTLLRLKRRRDVEPAEHLILEVPAASKKPRGMDALLAQLSAVNLAEVAPRSSNPGRKQRKFLRVTTVQQHALKTSAEVESLLLSVSSENAAGRMPVKSPLKHTADLAGYRQQRRAAALQTSKAARYQQVHKRRTSGKQADECVASNATPDVWQEAFHLYDIEAIAQEHQSQPAPIDDTMQNYMSMVQEYLGQLPVQDVAGLANTNKQPKMRHRYRSGTSTSLDNNTTHTAHQGSTSTPHQEVTSITHQDMTHRTEIGTAGASHGHTASTVPQDHAGASKPSVRGVPPDESTVPNSSPFLEAAADKVPQAAGKHHKPDGKSPHVTGRLPGDVTVSGSHDLDNSGEGASSSQEDGDEWVYDVYVPVEGSWDQMEWGEEGAGRETPVIEVSEDEDQLFWETQQEDDDVDSEDSNAENYYAASYPDEEDGGDEDDDGVDGLEYMYPDMRTAQRRDSDEDSYGDSSEEDEWQQPLGPRRYSN